MNDDRHLCHEIHVQLSALVAGELDADARAAVEQHLSYCPGCHFEWQDHELVWQCLAQCEDVDPPEELRRRVFDAIDEYERTVAKR
ncbi:MAG: zf-HC2 domain-containing protein [Acidobacteria bacterium]|nr:zf-HC2 domain-containing protein [Acidobacteriota bacterium]